MSCRLLRRLHRPPLLHRPALLLPSRLVRRRSGGLVELPPWTQREKTELLTLLHNEKGSWHKVISYVDSIPMRNARSWSTEERTRLSEYVTQRFFACAQPLDWALVARKFARSQASCQLMYYKMRGAERRNSSSNNNNKDSSKNSDDDKPAASDVTDIGDAKVCQLLLPLGSGGVVDWDTVASELQVPLVPLLNRVHESADPRLRELAARLTQPRPRPNKAPQFADKLTKFLSRFTTHVPWHLVALYMCTDIPACIPTTTLKKARRSWQPEELARLRAAHGDRQRFPKWSDIARHVGSRTITQCKSQWGNLQTACPATIAKAWAPQDIKKIDKVVQSSSKAPLCELLRLFPLRDAGEVRAELRRAQSRDYSRRTRQRAKSMTMRIVELRQNSEGWDEISKSVRLPRAVCRERHRAFVQKLGGVRKWTQEEHQRLVDALGVLRSTAASAAASAPAFAPASVPASVPAAASASAGTKTDWEAVALMVGSKTPNQCYLRYYYSLRPPKVK
ncbi:hypothetical protein GGI25_003554 [Coemansia spiralis]|uniref:Myb-like domain-containing protein n=2 Tax=Coemansia TaxID=4863 RepID=A0A9W8KXH7_9FUNG|nr:hypothetical protein EDC05_004088 [Coemansia umbellata]KAJ2622069.1 hypothetical protein GGI26_003511 [Coemansia sp. RSA 1358]KAJ2676519.1 hypothetical protein GGI25_003554 [Coemansia spiralis]